MANYDLGTARGVIELDYKGDGPKRAASDLDDLKRRSGDTGAAYEKVGGTMQKAGAAMGAGIAVAVKSAADFEQKMSGIKAVTHAGAADMETLRNKALQVGKDTSLSASEAASAIEELAKAGVSVPDIMNGAADATVALAEASGTDLSESAKIATAAMTNFKLSAQDLPHVADMLVGAADASSTSVSELGNALEYVGPVASAVGLNFDDTSTALTVLAKSGLTGEKAGTGLRNVLLGLNPTTKKQTEAFKELGLITKDGANLFYDANGKLKPFDQVVQILNEHTKGLSDQEKQTFYKGAFGEAGLPAAYAIAGQTSDQFLKLKDSLLKVKAADAAATRLDNFKGSLEKLKGSLETLMIQIGTPLLNAFRDLADGINTVVGGVLKLPPAVTEAGAKFAIFASGLLIAAGTIMKVVAFVGEFKRALDTLGIIAKVASMAEALGPALATIGTVATGPVGIIIAALTALGVAFYELYKHNEKFRNFVNGIVTALKEHIMLGIDRAKAGLQALADGFNGVTTGTGIIGFLQQVGAAARTFWEALQELWHVWQTSVWPILKDAGSQVWNALKDAWVQMKPALDQLWAALKQLWTALEPIRQPLFDILGVVLKLIAGFLLWSAKMNLDTIVALIKLAAAIMEKVAPAITVMADGLTGIIGIVTDVVTWLIKVITKIVEFATAVVQHFTAARDSVNSNVGSITSKIQEIIAKIQAVIDKIKIIWNAFWGGELPGPVGNAFTLIRHYIDEGWLAIKGAFDTAIATVKLAWTNFWNGVRDFVAPIWASIKGFVQSGIDGVKGIFQTVTGVIKGIWDGFWGSPFGQVVQQAWGLVKDLVNLGIAVVRDTIITQTNNIKSAWNAAWTAIRDFVGPIWTSIKSTITSAATAVRDFLSGVWNSIKITAEQMWNSLKTNASTIWTQIKTAITTAIDAVKGVLQAIWTSVKSTAESMWNGLKSSASSIWAAIKSAIEGPINAVKGVLQSAWNAIKSTAESVWNAIKSAAQSIWTAIKDAMVKPMNDAKSAVSGPINEIKRIVTDAWNAIKTATSDTWGKFASTVSDNVKKAIDAVGKIKDSVVNAVKDAGTWLINAGRDLVQGFIDGINKKLGDLRAKVKEMTDITKKHTQQELQAQSPSQVFLQYGKDVVQGFIDGIDKLFPGLRAKLQEFTDLVQKIAKEKLKIGSPSKIFHDFGIETMQGFINGLMSKLPEIQGIFDQLKAQFPEIQKAAADAASRFGINFTGNISDAVRQVQGSSDKIKSAIKDVFLTGNLRGQLSDALGIDIMEDSPLVDGILSMRDKIMASGGSLKAAAQAAVDKFTPIAQKLAPIGDKIVSALKPLPDKIKQIADAVKGGVQQIGSQLPKLTDLLNKFDAQDYVQEIFTTMPGLAKNFIAGKAIDTGIRQNGQPLMIQAPAPIVQGHLPDKITLKVGDREFNAYVDERADKLLSQAASLLAKGRK